MDEEIIRQINPKKTDFVLDITSGTSEPGLTIASLVTNGKVILSDLSEDMLEIAREKASKKGL